MNAAGVVQPGVTVLQNQNMAGYRVAFAPPVSAALGATCTLDTQSGIFSLSGNDHYNSPYPSNAGNAIRQGRHHLIDLSLNWTAPNKRYDVNLFVRNLTQQFTFAAVTVASSLAIVPGAPRTFGGSFGFHF